MNTLNVLVCLSAILFIVCSGAILKIQPQTQNTSKHLDAAISYDARQSTESVAIANATFDIFTDVVLDKESRSSLAQCENGHEKLKNKFDWADYCVLASMLIISCGIGVFYGFYGAKQQTSSDFLLGGSSMGTFPMAMSLAASYITAIELLGNPAEMYQYGTQFWMICIAFFVIVPLTSKFYLPVFMTLRLTSSYEYLGLRFSQQTSLLASGLYIIQMVLYTSVAVYAPALALSHVTGLNVYVAVSVVYIVSIFYASQGGMKAVIMTDTFQAIVIVGSILLVLCFGEQAVGGVGVIWSENYKTNRLEVFNMDPNPATRHSFWSVVVGGTFYWMTMYCANQASIQKYLSVQTLSQARSALWVASFGLVIIYTINFTTGMVLVANYRHCDPVKSGETGATDEILPLFVINELGKMQGLTGFFVAGIFAASLGTVAAALNSLSAVTCKDFITGAFGFTMPESKGALWAKWISIMYGIISFGLIFIVEQLGSVMQVALSFNGMVGGVTLGLFSLGMFFPWANSKGAVTGGVLSMIFVMWIGLGQQVAVASGTYIVLKKPISVDGCACLNSTLRSVIEPTTADDYNLELFFLYRISYLWYSAIGFLLTLIIGMTVSVLTGIQNPKDVHCKLLSPPLRTFYNSLPNNVKTYLNLPSSYNERVDDLIGVDNLGMDIIDENVQTHENCEEKTEYVNDISVTKL